jgi:predicted RNase H-like HicB family nuclease
MNHHEYNVKWSVEDDEYVGTCDTFPSLSWLALTPEEAMGGICQMVRDVEKDMQ